MSTPHPKAIELADFVDGTADDITTFRVAAHLRTCEICVGIVEEARQVQVAGHEPDLAGLAQAVPDELLPQRWRRALIDLEVSEPKAGQVWRLRAPDPFGDGSELTSLVVVIRATEDLLVAPVTYDPQESTDLWTAQLPVDGTRLVVAVWVSLAQPIGCEALDVYLGDVDATAVLALHRALRRGQQPPAGLVLGGPVTPELREYREELRSQLTLIGEQRLTGLLASSGTESEAVDVVDAVVASGWDLRRLAEVAGLTAREAHAVLNRHQALTEAQHAAVSQALGVSTTIGSVPAPERGLVAAVTTPLRRHRFGAVAERNGVDPWTFRAQRLAMRPAARANTGADADWDALVEQHLRRLEIAAGLREG